MSINVNIDLVSPLHMRTFAKFLADMADARDAKIAATDADRDRRWASEPAEAPDAAHIATQENSSVATVPTPEKKTRSRKAKDAPASSVPSADNDGQTDIEDAIKAGSPGPVGALGDEGQTGFPAISTGEERIGPADSPEVVAQDAADEAAESDAARDPANPLTLDDVRLVMGKYAHLYGMDSALADGPTIFTKALGDIPAGTKNAKGDVVTEWCLTATPLDQASLGKAVQYWTAAATENPFKRSKVAA